MADQDKPVKQADTAQSFAGVLDRHAYQRLTSSAEQKSLDELLDRIAIAVADEIERRAAERRKGVKQCRGKTKSGARCKCMALPDSDYCYHHLARAKKAADEFRPGIRASSLAGRRCSA